MRLRAILFGLFFTAILSAEEGLWLLTQLKQLDLKDAGIKIPAESIYHPRKTSISDAIVWLGGCSASFVSLDGLILTNHHCAYGALQRASTAKKDFIKDGFLAKSRSEEIQAIGMNAYVLEEVRDVTSKILKGIGKNQDAVVREKTIKGRLVALTEKIENGKDDVLAKIGDNFEGREYVLYVFKKYQDVRLVYAPPRSIGKYGGDIDNWMWPRHTGDFTYLRAYSARDGSGAKYSADNVPVKPKNWLKIAREPVAEGDATFILGYPGSTSRWRSSSSVAWNLEYGYPWRVQNYGEIIDLIDSITENDAEGEVKLASRRSGLANSMKNAAGKIRSMKLTGFLENKRVFENEFKAALKSDQNLNKKYGHILSEIDKQYELLQKNRLKSNVFDLFGSRGSVLAYIAKDIVHTVMEREKPDSERDPEFTERSVEKKLEKLYLRYYSYYLPVDRALLSRALTMAFDLPESQRIHGLKSVFPGGVGDLEKFVDKAFSETRLTDVDYARSLYYKSLTEIKSMDEPLLQLMCAIYEEEETISKDKDIFSARITELRKEYINALFEWKGGRMYSDANSTMRFTYGDVAGYKPADAVWYKPFTTLKGVIDKATGEWPFNMPDTMQTLYDNKDFGNWKYPALNDVPVAFLHKCDITGGNSGSAVLNSRGELIGLAFDGNWEAMTSDWQYSDALQRTISVNIHYVLFVTEKVAGADFLLEEMGIID